MRKYTWASALRAGKLSAEHTHSGEEKDASCFRWKRSIGNGERNMLGTWLSFNFGRSKHKWLVRSATGGRERHVMTA